MPLPKDNQDAIELITRRPLNPVEQDVFNRASDAMDAIRKRKELGRKIIEHNDRLRDELSKRSKALVNRLISENPAARDAIIGLVNKRANDIFRKKRATYATMSDYAKSLIGGAVEGFLGVDAKREINPWEHLPDEFIRERIGRKLERGMKYEDAELETMRELRSDLNAAYNTPGAKAALAAGKFAGFIGSAAGIGKVLRTVTAGKALDLARKAPRTFATLRKTGLLAAAEGMLDWGVTDAIQSMFKDESRVRDMALEGGTVGLINELVNRMGKSGNPRISAVGWLGKLALKLAAKTAADQFVLSGITGKAAPSKLYTEKQFADLFVQTFGNIVASLHSGTFDDLLASHGMKRAEILKSKNADRILSKLSRAAEKTEDVKAKYLNDIRKLVDEIETKSADIRKRFSDEVFGRKLSEKSVTDQIFSSADEAKEYLGKRLESIIESAGRDTTIGDINARLSEIHPSLRVLVRPGPRQARPTVRGKIRQPKDLFSGRAYVDPSGIDFIRIKRSDFDELPAAFRERIDLYEQLHGEQPEIVMMVKRGTRLKRVRAEFMSKELLKELNDKLASGTAIENIKLKGTEKRLQPIIKRSVLLNKAIERFKSGRMTDVTRDLVKRASSDAVKALKELAADSPEILEKHGIDLQYFSGEADPRTIMSVIEDLAAKYPDNKTYQKAIAGIRRAYALNTISGQEELLRRDVAINEPKTMNRIRRAFLNVQNPQHVDNILGFSALAGESRRISREMAKHSFRLRRMTTPYYSLPVKDRHMLIDKAFIPSLYANSRMTKEALGKALGVAGPDLDKYYAAYTGVSDAMKYAASRYADTISKLSKAEGDVYDIMAEKLKGQIKNANFFVPLRRTDRPYSVSVVKHGPRGGKTTVYYSTYDTLEEARKDVDAIASGKKPLGFTTVGKNGKRIIHKEIFDTDKHTISPIMLNGGETKSEFITNPADQFTAMRMLRESIDRIAQRLESGDVKRTLLKDLERELTPELSNFKKSQLTRRFVHGYRIDDIDRAISEYIDSAVNDMTRNRWMALGSTILNDVPMRADVRNRINRFIAAQIRKSDQFERLAANMSYLSSAYYLWMKMATPILNDLSAITGTLDAYALQKHGMKIPVGEGQKTLLKSYSDVHKMWLRYAADKFIRKVKDPKKLIDNMTKGLSKEERYVIERAFMEGIIDDPMARQFRDEVSKLRGNARIFQKVIDAGFGPMAETEKLARGTTMLAMYRIFRKNGMGIGKAFDAAHEFVEKAHGLYGKRGKLFIETSPDQITRSAAKLALTLSRWTTNKMNVYAQILNNMRKGKAIDNAAYHLLMNQLWMFALGGIGAVGLGPLNVSNTLDTLKSALWLNRKSMPKGLDIERAKENSDFTSRFITRGLPGIAGIIPGTEGIDFSEAIKVSLPNPLKGGVIGSIAGDIAAAYGLAKRGEKRRAIERIAPGQIKKVLQMEREYREGVSAGGIPVRMKGGKLLKPSGGEALLRGLTGLQPVSEKTRSTVRTFRIKDIRTKWNDYRARVIYEIRRAIASGDRKKAVTLQRDFNARVRDENRKAGFRVAPYIVVGRLKKFIKQE